MGSVEVRVFVRMLADALIEALQKRDALVESVMVHGPDAQPSSIDLTVLGKRELLADLTGTHVLVQPSPHRGKRSRKRWYAGVTLVQRVAADATAINLRDVAFETCRASGAGGQHINKTESAVRALHKPTGLCIRVESERSQHQNKRRALEAIASALATRQAAEAARNAGERRHRSLQVERGRPVASWRILGGKLAREPLKFS
jgi:peptide chain release factor